MWLKGLRHFSRSLWLAAAFCLIGFALLISVGRYYIQQLDNYREPLARELSQRLGLDVRIAALHGDWQPLGPVVHLEGLELSPQANRTPAIMLERAEVSLDLIRSLLARSPRFSTVSAEGLALVLEQTSDGAWHLQGSDSQAPMPPPEQLLTALGWLGDAELRRTHLQLLPYGREPRGIELSRLALANRLGVTGLRAELMLPGGREPVSLRAQVEHGLGGPVLQAHVAFKGLQLSGLEWSSQDIQAVDLGGQLWLDWSGKTPLVMRAELSADRLQLVREGQSYGWEAPALQLRLQDDQDKGLSIDMALAPSQLLGVEWPTTRLQLASADRAHWRLWVDRLHAPTTNALLLKSGVLSAHLADMFNTMALQGELRDVWLEFPVEGARKFDLRAQLARVGLTPFQNIPGGTGISGLLQADAKGGRVELDTDDFSMSFPGVYHLPLDFKHASGVVRWHLFDHHAVVESGPLALEGEDGHARGLLRLNLPYEHSGGPAEMELAIGLRDSDASRRNKFIPYILSDDLRKWLDDSIKQGHVNESAFWFRGSLDHGGARTVQLFFDVAGGTLQYHKDWPAITDMDGLVVIDDTYVLAEPRRARVFNAELQQGRVEVRAHDDVVVDVSSGLQGDTGDILRLVNESPIRSKVGDGLAEWKATGAATSRINLHLPLKQGSLGPDAVVEVDSQLVDARLDMAPLRLPIEHLNGLLHFDLKQGLSAPALMGELWQRPVEAQLRTQNGELQLDAKARVRGADGARWLGLPAFVKLNGVSEYRVKLRQPSGERRSIQVESSLQGTAIELPPPFGKARDEKRPISVSVDSQGDNQQLGIRHGSIDAQLQLRQWALQGGGIGVGAGRPQSASDRVQVSGRLAEFDYSLWQDVFKAANAPAATAAASGDWRDRVRLEGLRIDKLNVGALVLPDARVDARRDNGAWVLRIDSQPLAGHLELSDDTAKPVALDLDYLRLEAPPPPPPPGVIPPDPWADMNPASLPAVDVVVRQFKRGEQDYGQWQLRLRPIPDGTRIDGLKGTARGLTIAGLGGKGEGVLEWRRMADGSHLSQIKARFSATDLGDVLEAWQYGRSIRSDSARFDVDTSWPASPAGERMAIMTGDIGIDITKGSFLKVSGRTDALRLMGLLNFDAVVRRLRLDFSDLYGQGLSFDKVHGRMKLMAGTARFSPALDIQCPSSQFQLDASLDLNAETIDGQMQVTLPLSGNLPWVAGLVAGLPVAAGVFVASKLLEHQVNTLTSAVYEVHGPWVEPRVEFQRATDVKEKPPSPPLEKAHDTPPGQPADAQRPGAPGQP